MDENASPTPPKCEIYRRFVEFLPSASDDALAELLGFLAEREHDQDTVFRATDADGRKARQPRDER